MLPDFLTSIINWLRKGYPEGVPENDYIPLVAILARRLTEQEITQVISQCIAEGLPIEELDIKVAITKVTSELPREEDVNRVQARLAEAGWPLSDADEFNI